MLYFVFWASYATPYNPWHRLSSIQTSLQESSIFSLPIVDLILIGLVHLGDCRLLHALVVFGLMAVVTWYAS